MRAVPALRAHAAGRTGEAFASPVGEREVTAARVLVAVGARPSLPELPGHRARHDLRRGAGGRLPPARAAGGGRRRLYRARARQHLQRAGLEDHADPARRPALARLRARPAPASDGRGRGARRAPCGTRPWSSGIERARRLRCACTPAAARSRSTRCIYATGRSPVPQTARPGPARSMGVAPATQRHRRRRRRLPQQRPRHLRRRRLQRPCRHGAGRHGRST